MIEQRGRHVDTGILTIDDAEKQIINLLRSK